LVDDHVLLKVSPAKCEKGSNAAVTVGADALGLLVVAVIV